MKKTSNMSVRELLSTYKLTTEVISVAEANRAAVRKQYVEDYAGIGELTGTHWLRYVVNGYTFEIGRYNVNLKDLVPEGCGEIPETVEEFVKLKEDLKQAVKAASRACLALKYIEGCEYYVKRK